MHRRIILLTGTTATLLAGPLATGAMAKDASIGEVAAAVNSVWIVVAAILVMFMQAGFALVEAGFTRAKNAGNIIMKNVMDFSLGSLTYWAFRFALAYGGSIISGAVAGRVKFTSYLIYTPFITGLIYPVATHWVWGGGWLSEIGFFDFAGSGVVHMLGGVAALAGVLIVGPRIGKYDENGKASSIPGHSVTLGALGVFILWFGWYGFNAGSTPAVVGQDIASPAVTTTLAAAAGALGAMFTAWIITGKPDVGFTLNGVLAGLVGVTAGTASLSFGGSILVGLIAGVIMVFSVMALERVGIDDPVGAISVHGTAGLWGLIAVGLLTSDANVGIQLVGALAIAAWAFGTSFLVFKVIDLTVGMRVTPSEEREGLDRSEHGGEAYPEFVFQELVASPRDLDPVGTNGN
jgi:Amt family ammonium transporter